MARYAFSIDLDRCIGCQACAVACGAGNALPAGGEYLAVTDLVRPGPGGLWGSHSHHRCQHCAAAPCVQVCPTGALSKWNGLTAVAAERCSGCGYCVEACPYQVPRLRDGAVAKCVGCADRVQAGGAPWCEQTCPSQAIRFGERETLLAEARERAERLRGRYPRAQVYGEAQLGGLGLVTVLLDAPATYGLPEAPRASPAVAAWQAVRPTAAGLTAAAALSMGVMFVVARRRHVRERDDEAGGTDSGSDHPPPGPGGTP